MTDPALRSGPPIEQSISASIRKAIGEKLVQSLQPNSSPLPRHLEELLSEMRRRESGGPEPERRTMGRSQT